MITLLYDPGTFERVKPDDKEKLICMGVFQLCNVPFGLQIKLEKTDFKKGVDYVTISNDVFLLVGVRILNTENSINQYKSFCEFFEEHFNVGHPFGELVYRKSNSPLMKRYFQIYDTVKQYELSK